MIPILVDRTPMPDENKLPDLLKKLAYLHAPSIDTGPDFHPQMERFIRRLDAILQKSELAASLQSEATRTATANSTHSRFKVEQASSIAASALKDAVTEQLPPAGILPDVTATADRSLSMVRQNADSSANPATPLASVTTPAPSGHKRRFKKTATLATTFIGMTMFAWFAWPEPLTRKEPEKPEQVSSSKHMQNAPALTATPPTGSGQLEKSSFVRNPAMGMTAPRVALVIANSNYPDAEKPLGNSISDARAVARALEANGFGVELGENLPKQEMQQVIERFRNKVRPGAVAVLFFSGYGIQTGRVSYILPINSAIWSDQDVRRDGFSIEGILREIDAKGASIKLAVLDASRKNPFERRFRHMSTGLAPIGTPKGTLIISAAGPDTVVPEDVAEKSLFVQELLAQARTPGLSVEDILKRTRLSVSRASKNEQVPWISSSTTEDFSFAQSQPLSQERRAQE